MNKKIILGFLFGLSIVSTAAAQYVPRVDEPNVPRIEDKKPTHVPIIEDEDDKKPKPDASRPKPDVARTNGTTTMQTPAANGTTKVQMNPNIKVTPNQMPRPTNGVPAADPRVIKPQPNISKKPGL